MKKETKKSLSVSISFLAAFLLWTLLVRMIDRQAIGPLGSVVGFAKFNGYVHELFDVHMFLYDLTDLLSIIPLAIVFGFGVLGLVQWIKRKKLFSIDRDIIALGLFYIAVFSVFIAFEILVINYRPVLIEGVLEASYPSSTTMLAMCVLPTAAMQFKARIQNKALKECVFYLTVAFTVFMVLARLISGVHWITDIIGGALLSTGLVTMYYTYK